MVLSQERPNQPTLLGIAPETRFQIYDHLINCTGVISVFANYEIAQEVDQQTIDLLHVCHTIRTEVQEAFYKHQAFEFRSYQAMQNFCKSVGPYHVSIIKNIELGYLLCRRALDTFRIEVCDTLKNHLTSVERLTINDPNRSFVRRYGHHYNDKIGALRAVSPHLSAAKLYYKCTDSALSYVYGDPLYPKFLFVPKECHLSDEIQVKSIDAEGVEYLETVYYMLVE